MQELIDLTREKFALFTIAAMSYVAALAWNEAFKSLFAPNGVFYFVATWGIWLYPIFATICAVIVIVIVSKTVFDPKKVKIEG